jgi:CelD/BcsL family acetyltransferase involved in cellulose biosynthesis
MRAAATDGGGAHWRATAVIVDVPAATDSRWAELVATQPTDVFNSPAWARVLEDAYGFEVRAKVVLDEDDRPVAGMAYVDVEDLRGRRIVSLPFSDFCDPVVADDRAWDSLSAAITTLGAPVTVRCLRHDITPGERWAETGTYAWHRVDARREVDEIWASLHPSGRRAIRKAEASGVEVVAAASPDDLRSFFELHLRVRKHKYGLLAQPYRFFQAIWNHFLEAGDGRLLLALVDGTPVGGALYLEWKDTLYYKFNASSVASLEVRPNDLVVWKGLAHARSRSLSWLDFGVSDWDQEGLVRYKRKYATDEGVVRRFTSEPVAEDDVGPLLGEVTGLLVHPAVPDHLTERGGDVLYRFFA